MKLDRVQLEHSFNQSINAFISGHKGP